MLRTSRTACWRSNGIRVTAELYATTLGHLAHDLAADWGPGTVKETDSLARYTAIRIGGPAELLFVAESVEALRSSITRAWELEIPCRVLGGGSNVLISDAGVPGLVVLNRARAVSFPSPGEHEGWGGGYRVRAESGASFSTVARQCVTRGLAGLEWAASIPGTVGGAVVGNAGAWGGDVASTLLRARLLEPGGAITVQTVEQLGYGYRSSTLKRRDSLGARAVVLEAEFALEPGDREALEVRVSEIAARRKLSQPPGATCGSVFKNPSGDYAARLIEAAGLKGERRGGAEISPVHANFIVNRRDAAAADVKALIELVRRAVHASFGVTLELEIELVGDW